ncbi:WYL domain-containing protein [Heyndrickxia oleronia]|uniref:WYL domain-containing protein n=1 Tax=Heyndrickxia oleronia TaxID=38875 RepID=UPI0037519CC4
MKGLLLRAVESHKNLEMIYQSNKGEITQRVIRVEKVGEQSFRAYCYTRKQVRTFKLSNILSIAPLKLHKRGA